MGFNAMSQQPVLLNLPDELYERIQQIAEESQRSVEAVMLESLDLLFSQKSPNDDLDTMLTALSKYTDEELWALVHRRMAWSQSMRLHELSDKGKRGILPAQEQRELDGLLAQVDRDMLLRSEALLLLKQRGHHLEPYLSNS